MHVVNDQSSFYNEGQNVISLLYRSKANYTIHVVNNVIKTALNYGTPGLNRVCEFQFFLCYIRKPGFQFQTSQPGPGFTTNFTNTPKRSFRKFIIIKKKVLHIILFVRHHGFHMPPNKTLEVQSIIFERSSSSP